MPARSSDADDFLDRIVEAAPDDGATVGAGTAVAPGPDVPAAAAAGEPGSAAPTVVAWFGDSVALTLLFATTTYVDDGPGPLRRPAHVDRLRRRPLPARRRSTAASTSGSRRCRASPTSGASVGIVMSCQWELLPVPLPGSGSDVVRSPGDPEYDAYVRDAYVDAIDQLRAGGFERVLWVLCPHQSLERRGRATSRRSSVTGAIRPAWTTTTRSSGPSPTSATT